MQCLNTVTGMQSIWVLVTQTHYGYERLLEMEARIHGVDIHIPYLH